MKVNCLKLMTLFLNKLNSLNNVDSEKIQTWEVAYGWNYKDNQGK